jgi:cytochrome c biogenesis protein ResB
MQKVKRFLLSRKTVISLICAVFISCLLGSAVPQIARKTPQFFTAWEAKSPRIYHVIDLLQLNQVYTSAWFLIIVALTALCLAYSVYYQSRALLKSKKPFQRETNKGPFKDYVALKSVRSSGSGVGKTAHADIERVFRIKGYRPYLVTERSRYFVFGKNKVGRWGSVIFHLGLLFCIAAALYGLAFQKRGFIQLVQADTFRGKDTDWQTRHLGVFAGDFNLGFQVRLDKLTPSYWEDNRIKDMEASLTITDEKDNAWEFVLSPAIPVHFAGTKVYQSNYYGYVLGFIMEKEGGNKAFTNFFLDGPGRKNEPFAGETDFPTSDYILNMKFYPNLIEPSFYATLPGVDLIVTEKGEQRFKGRVLFSQRARLNDDTTLAFVQMRYWTGLSIVKNRGMPLVYWGFALTTMGALVVFMLPYKEIHLKITEDRDHILISMGGRTKKYGPLFSEEFNVLTEELEKLLGEHGNSVVKSYRHPSYMTH